MWYNKYEFDIYQSTFVYEFKIGSVIAPDLIATRTLCIEFFVALILFFCYDIEQIS